MSKDFERSSKAYERSAEVTRTAHARAEAQAAQDNIDRHTTAFIIERAKQLATNYDTALEFNFPRQTQPHSPVEQWAVSLCCTGQFLFPYLREDKPVDILKAYTILVAHFNTIMLSDGAKHTNVYRWEYVASIVGLTRIADNGGKEVAERFALHLAAFTEAVNAPSIIDYLESDVGFGTHLAHYQNACYDLAQSCSRVNALRREEEWHPIPRQFYHHAVVGAAEVIKKRKARLNPITKLRGGRPRVTFYHLPEPLQTAEDEQTENKKNGDFRLDGWFQSIVALGTVSGYLSIIMVGHATQPALIEQSNKYTQMRTTDRHILATNDRHWVLTTDVSNQDSFFPLPKDHWQPAGVSNISLAEQIFTGIKGLFPVTFDNAETYITDIYSRRYPEATTPLMVGLAPIIIAVIFELAVKGDFATHDTVARTEVPIGFGREAEYKIGAQGQKVLQHKAKIFADTWVPRRDINKDLCPARVKQYCVQWGKSVTTMRQHIDHGTLSIPPNVTTTQRHAITVMNNVDYWCRRPDPFLSLSYCGCFDTILVGSVGHSFNQFGDEERNEDWRLTDPRNIAAMLKPRPKPPPKPKTPPPPPPPPKPSETFMAARPRFKKPAQSNPQQVSLAMNTQFWENYFLPPALSEAEIRNSQVLPQAEVLPQAQGSESMIQRRIREINETVEQEKKAKKPKTEQPPIPPPISRQSSPDFDEVVKEVALQKQKDEQLPAIGRDPQHFEQNKHTTIFYHDISPSRVSPSRADKSPSRSPPPVELQAIVQQIEEQQKREDEFIGVLQAIGANVQASLWNATL